MVKLHTRECLYAFGITEQSENYRTYATGTLHSGPSRPSGLIVWGATDETEILQIECGNYLQLNLSTGIPARFFETGRTFEEIEKLAEAGELEISLPARQILKMTSLEIGSQLCVKVRGPLKKLVAWGRLAESPRPVYAEIKRIADTSPGGANGERFRGRVVRPTFDGEEEIFVVEGPSESVCATLMAPAAAGTGGLSF